MASSTRSVGTDHSEQRRKVADAAIRAIMKGGVAAGTLKDVAAEGGWSTGVVQHYFRNKRELILAAVDVLASQSEAALEHHRRNSPGRAFDALHAYCVAVVPAKAPRTQAWWRVWVCLWAGATSDPALAAAVREYRTQWRGRLAELIREGQRDRSILSTIDADEEAKRLAGQINGRGIDSLFDPDLIDGDVFADQVLQRLAPARRSPTRQQHRGA